MTIKTSTVLLSLLAFGLPVAAVEPVNGLPRLQEESTGVYVQAEELKPDKEYPLMFGQWARVYNDGSTGEHIPDPGQITVTFIPAGQGIAFLSIHNKEGKLLESWGCSSTFPEPCTVKAFQIPAYVKLTVSVNPKITTDVKVLYVHE